MTTSTIVNWEKNHTRLTYTYYKNICDFLDYCPVEKPATTLPLKLHYIRAYLFGMGQREFAKFTGYSESTILKWETGYSRPSIHSAHKLSSICDINIAYKSEKIYNPYAKKSGFLSDRVPDKIGSHIHAAGARKKLSCRQAAKQFHIDHNNFIAWKKYRNSHCSLFSRDHQIYWILSYSRNKPPIKTLFESCLPERQINHSTSKDRTDL